MASGRIVVNENRCKGCGLCVDACPPGVIALADYLNTSGYRPAVLRDPEFLCTGCGLCAVVCPDVAITVFRDLPVVKIRQSAMEVA